MNKSIDDISDPEMRSQIEKVASFHGYLSTSAFAGIQMLNLARRVLGVSNKDRLFVTCETYNCLPDPFQVLAGCTVGNKGLKILDHGKMAVTVSRRASTGSIVKGVRVMLDPAKTVMYPRLHAWFMKTEEIPHPETISILLSAGENIYTYKILDLVVPRKLGKKIAVCECCKESFVQKSEEMLCVAFLSVSNTVLVIYQVIDVAKKLIPSLCPYCAVGCAYYIEVEKDRAIGIKYMPEHPTSEGALCPKGNAVLEILNHEERLRYPLRRIGDEWVRISWDEALDLLARNLAKAIKNYGPKSLGFLASSRCNNEENYLMQKMARLLGSPNVDNCARLCHSPTVVGLGSVLGTGAMTNNIVDLENSKCILAIGTNFTEAHPVVSRWVNRAKDNGAVVIVADPRITSTSWMSDIHLRIKPGSDIDLIRGMMKVIIDEGLSDNDFIVARTEGFSELVKSLEGYSVKEAAESTGIPAEDIAETARIYAKSPASMILYSMGITQHVCGTDNVKACVGLSLICGQIGRPGAGILPMRGQNNVQGTCDVGAMAEFYPGYKRASDPKSVEFFKTGWNARDLPSGPGLTSTEMTDAALEGKLKAMYIIGEDPVICDANVNKTKEALENLDFLVVQEIFMTATAKMADVVLPAAAWAEKDGSYTSMERRVQWIDQAMPPIGEAREGMWIISQIANRLGLDFNYAGASEVLKEMNSLMPIYGGMTKERISKVGGLQWPCPEEKHPGTDILHTERFSTPYGKARIACVENRPPGEETTPEYPILLTTGRIVLHYNSGSMTRRSPSLDERDPKLYVEINPKDAAMLKINDGDVVLVKTRRGEAEAVARVSDKVKPGVAFMPFHWSGTNLITSDALDPVSKIPEYKMAACRIEVVS